MTRRSGHRRWGAVALVISVAVAGLVVLVSEAQATTRPPGATVSDRVRDAVTYGGQADVVVTLRTNVPIVPAPDEAAAQQRESALGRAARAFVDDLPRGVTSQAPARESRYVPVTLDAEGLAALEADPGVESVTLNEARRPLLATSANTVGAPVAWSTGYTGQGQSVAVLDTGVKANHPMLSGKVVDGACFSSPLLGGPLQSSLCPGGAPTATGVASAAPCSGAVIALECSHGTHVAGIAAGGAAGDPRAPSGIAPEADLVAIQVFTFVTSPAHCPESQCIVAWDHNVLAALDWVITHAATHDIAAANLSLGGSTTFAGDCDFLLSDYAAAFSALRAAGVAPVVASGNSGETTEMSAPACVSSAIAVGSVNTSDLEVSAFSNASSSLDLLAPGARRFDNGGIEGIWSSIPGVTPYAHFFGTSMAAPHVAGAWALLRQAYGDISVDEAEALLESTGRMVEDVAGDFPLIQLDEAMPRPKGTYHPVDPARVLDTRFGNGAPRARVGAGKSIDLQVGGRGGVPSSGVSAVVLNVTSVAPSGFGFVTVFPTGVLRPLASNLNLNPGEARPNLVTVRMGAGGKVTLYNEAGTVDLVADVAGWYDTEATNNGSYYHPASPTRVLDTRIGRGAPQGKVGAGGTLTIDVTGVDAELSTVPDGADAVVVNLVGTGATAGTHVTAYPTGIAAPETSNVNLSPGQTRPNLAIIPLDPDGEGRLTLRNNAGAVDLIADIQGWYDGDDSGYRFVPKSPSRILDTRFGVGRTGSLGTNQNFPLQVTGQGNVPTSGVAGVVMNVTSTGVTLGGFVTVYPGDLGQPPLASNLNLEIGRDVPNLVMTRLPPNGRARMYNAVGQVHLISDVAGWFVA
jgi:subtilisin family serine protease